MTEEKKGRFGRLAEHVRRYLIAYVLVTVGLAVTLGYLVSAFTATANKNLLSNLVIVLAILTIYPSMVQLKTEGIASGFRSWKPIAVMLVYVFAVAPVIAFLVAPTFGNSQVGEGFFVANIVPASSASLGYILIAGGAIELATVLAVVSFAVAIPAIPVFLDLYGHSTSSATPVGPILTSVALILVLPFVVGQLTRYPLRRWKGPKFVNQTIRPHLALATMLSMFGLVFVLVAREASVIVTRPELVGELLGYQSVIILGLLLVSAVVSRTMRLSYADHQAVAFVSVTKNQSVAAGIATLALTPTAALAPSIIPMIQPVLAVLYIQLEGRVRRFLGQGSGPESGPVGGAGLANHGPLVPSSRDTGAR
jgi:ACR3 family arsenite efflux pump ArsB